MTTSPRNPAPTAPDAAPADRAFLRLSAVLGLLGATLLIGTNVLGSLMIDNHDWVADTVSDLAAGDLESIQDVGLYSYAAGLLAVALGASHLRITGWRWLTAMFSLVLLGILVTIIAARNEYGDGDSEGTEIHIYLVYGLGAVFTVLFLAAAQGLGRIGPAYRWLSLVCGGLWALGAPIFFMLPTSIDGAWERGLGLVTCVWMAGVSVALWRAADTQSMPSPNPQQQAAAEAA